MRPWHAHTGSLKAVRIGQKAPAIDAKDLDGQRLRLADYRGRVVVLTFWATWCGPCVKRFPMERELVRDMEGKPFVLLGVNNDRVLDHARRAESEKHVTWRSVWDGPGSGAIAADYGVSTWPATFVIDHEGVIRDINPTDPDLLTQCRDLVSVAGR